MSRFRPRSLRLRSLLADVLPFELPLTFTNDFFFASTLPLNCAPGTTNAIERLRHAGSFTVPLSYEVVKERGKVISLSIAHPIAQLRMAGLVDDFAETIISYCSKSAFSLRRPSQIVSLFADVPIEQHGTARDGLPHDLLEDGAPDFSRMASYFRLKRYNLLAKFIDSNEFINLEKRFSRLMNLDISKCFYNIYTHSVSWALKGKAFTKRSIGLFSFESQFDEVMQFANYKETNGIIVGPEISRIFAELIFQQVDRNLEHVLAEVHQLGPSQYAVRRYVDDYNVFANSDQVLEIIERELGRLLGEYKLYLNADKRKVQARPFVTAITRMKHSLEEIVDEIARELRTASLGAQTPCERIVADSLRSKLRNCRIVMHSPEVGFHNVSGWLLWKYRRMLRDALRLFARSTNDPERDCTSRIVAAIFESVFYVLALDFRVRTGFNLAVLINELVRSTAGNVTEQAEWLNNYVFEELSLLTSHSLERSGVSAIEFLNLLLLGAHSFGVRFVRSSTAKAAFHLLRSEEVSYFTYTVLKFSYLKDSAFFAPELSILNHAAETIVRSKIADLKTDSETYLLFCDLISAPDLALDAKKALVDFALSNDIRAGRIGATTDLVAEELGRLIGFTDWSGARLYHTLARRQLRAGREY